MREVAKDWTLAVVAGLSMLGMFVLLWSWAYSEYTTPVIAERTATIPTHVYAGTAFQLCRELEFRRPVTVKVNRWMVSRYSDVEINYAMPEATVVRQQGKLYQCRYIDVPRNIVPGVYTLHTSIEYTTWPFWKNYRVMPSVKITVLGE